MEFKANRTKLFVSSVAFWAVGLGGITWLIPLAKSGEDIDLNNGGRISGLSELIARVFGFEPQLEVIFLWIGAVVALVLAIVLSFSWYRNSTLVRLSDDGIEFGLVARRKIDFTAMAALELEEKLVGDYLVGRSSLGKEEFRLWLWLVQDPTALSEHSFYFMEIAKQKQY